MRPYVLFAGSMLFVAAFAGCGGSGDEIEVAEVSGVVTLDGKPLPNAIVTFVPKAGGPSGVGKTDAEGKYQLATVDELGAVLGEHMVSIVCVPEPTAGPEVAHGEDYQKEVERTSNYKPKPVTKVPERYNMQTELVEKVEEGSNTINFDLKS